MQTLPLMSLIDLDSTGQFLPLQKTSMEVGGRRRLPGGVRQ